MRRQTAPEDNDMTDQPWLRSYPNEIDWGAAIPTGRLDSLLDDAAQRYPNNRFIDFLGRSYTYAGIADQVSRAAAGFQELGVGKGVKVGLFLPNCPHFIIAYYGILQAGGTVVNYNPLYAEEEVRHQVEDSETDFMVTLSLQALYPKAAAMLRTSRVKKLIVGTLHEALPFPKKFLFPLFKRGEIARVPNDARHLSFRELLHGEGSPQPVDIDPETDVAVLQYTGGTTGVSKGAMLTHANLYANTHQTLNWFTNLEPGQERMMGVLPLFHVFAMTVVMNVSIAAGAEIILHPRFELDAVMKDIATKKPTIMPGVPTIYAALINHPGIANFDLTSIKACLSGGAPLPLDIKERFEALSGCKLFEGYGLTESAPVATCNPMFGLNKEASIGLPVPGTTIEITDRDDPEKLMPVGAPGEIRISGPQVMAGYLGRPEATAESLIDGRLRTGDVGYMDEDGYTFIIDRMKDIIFVGGFNVYPRNVEEAIYRHPAVEEVTVIGIPDDYQGESVKAFIKIRAGGELTEEALIEFLKDKLGKSELPRFVEFREALPKTMIGKLSKKELVTEEQAKYDEAKKAADPRPD
jgi:long-chain acyl-CoA synthetase